TEILLFSAARSQLVAGRIMNLLKQGEIVLLDRFYDSTTAYQGFGRNSLQLNDIRHLNRIAAHNIVPDLTFYLRIGYEEAELRLGERVKDRMEGSGKEFYLKTILGFDEISEREERIVVLDATRPADEIHRAVVEKVREFGISV
ncbi:MAG: dTMP kinase, partial [Balneolaceae bacterium]